MKREIKFRAWDGKQMKNGFNIFAYNGDIFSNSGYEKDWPLMQFTGLKDKTRNRKFTEGKEIYEGDIFEWADLIGVVEFKDGCFVFQCQGMGMTMRDHEPREYKVIGNIYENAELLSNSK